MYINKNKKDLLVTINILLQTFVLYFRNKVSNRYYKKFAAIIKMPSDILLLFKEQSLI